MAPGDDRRHGGATRRRRAARVVGPLVAATMVTVVTACGGGAAPPTAIDPSATGPAAELAPSQLTAETVAPPELPPPCDPDVLVVWSARPHEPVRGDEPAVGSVLRVEHRGTERCELDVGASPLRAAEMEPDLWLAGGEWGELVLAPTGIGCGPPAVYSAVEVVVGDPVDPVDGDAAGAIAVPTAAASACGLAFVALYPIPSATEACRPEQVSVAPGGGGLAELLVVTVRDGPCTLGELGGVRGAVADPAVDGGGPIVALAPGDLAAIRTLPVGGCAGGGRLSATLEFAQAGPVPVDLPSCRSVELGGLRSLLAEPTWPLAAAAGASDSAAAIDAALADIESLAF